MSSFEILQEYKMPANMEGAHTCPSLCKGQKVQLNFALILEKPL